jgi:hypothetical protein
VFALVLGAAAAIAAVGTAGASSTQVGKTALDQTAFCSKVSSGQLQASSGARSYCFGAQPNGRNAPAGAGAASQSAPTPFTSNHNAANPLEDVAPNGTHAYGQSETSIAGYNQYGVEAWNDSTGFFSPACSAMSKDELTGVGFTNNHGASWTDLGGLPNNSCSISKWEGDPSVQPYQGPTPDAPSGTAAPTTTYFYVASLITNTGCTGAPQCDAPKPKPPASACNGLCVGLDVKVTTVASNWLATNSDIVPNFGDYTAPPPRFPNTGTSMSNEGGPDNGASLVALCSNLT